MEDSFLNSAPTHFNHPFTMPDMDSPSSRRSHRHYSNGMTTGYDRAKKLQGDNDYLRERVKSCELGLGLIYQAIVNASKQQKAQKGSGLHRSASLTYQFGSGTNPAQDQNHFNDTGTELDEISSSIPQVTVVEVQNAVDKVLSERADLLSEVDDLKQITEAAKRERVLAIDEKDQLLRETHSLRVSVESSKSALSEYEEERTTSREKMQAMQEELNSLKKDKEQANRLKTQALEERSKIIQECASLQEDLRRMQAERAELYEDSTHLQRNMEDMDRKKRRLEQELDWLEQKTLEARNHLEKNEAIGGKVQDIMELSLVRDNVHQPWGFTVEGGKGSEFYHQDPSIVVTATADHTPADSVVRFGDRIYMFGSHSFRNVTRKEAADIIRSCDLTTVTMEVGRVATNIRPSVMDLKIPGRRDFGFSYETRLFVTSTEEDSIAMDYLLPGDEIVQVNGKSAFNMKSSVLKQLLKSSKDGLSLTIQRQSGISHTPSPSLTSHRHHHSHSEYTSSMGNGHAHHHPTVGHDSKLMFLHPGTRSNGDMIQSPGTPKSNVSDHSMGYHSLTHGDISNSANHPSHLELIGADSATGQLPQEQTLSLAVPDRVDGFARYRHGDGSGYASPQPLRSHTLSGPSSAAGFSKSNYRTRPVDFYTPRRNTTGHSYGGRTGTGLRPRTCSNSMPRSSISPNLSSRMENGQALHFSYPQKTLSMSLTRSGRPATTHFADEESAKPFSFSADNLDSDDVVPETSPTRKCQTPKHDKPHSHSKDGEMRGGFQSPPGKYSRGGRGMLSRSMGNMQTHV